MPQALGATVACLNSVDGGVGGLSRSAAEPAEGRRDRIIAPRCAMPPATAARAMTPATPRCAMTPVTAACATKRAVAARASRGAAAVRACRGAAAVRASRGAAAVRASRGATAARASRGATAARASRGAAAVRASRGATAARASRGAAVCATTETTDARTTESDQRGCTTRARVRASRGWCNERMGCKHAALGHGRDGTTQEHSRHTAQGSRDTAMRPNTHAHRRKRPRGIPAPAGGP
jgi:hypothetical protein